MTGFHTPMKFSHTADCHLGGHRDPRLRKLTEEAFERFVSQSIEDGVDFCIIAGDLFNTAIPGIDTMKIAVTQLGRLRSEGIRVYAVPGSHDYSPSGKTVLDVLERAELLVNVFRGSVEDGRLRLELTEDGKTGCGITGILGKRGMLDRQLYKDLDPSIGEEPGEKIFVFHTALEELKPKRLERIPGQPLSFLPRGFTYYAGGHVHIVERYSDEQYRNVVYPGPLFPNSFSELEDLEHGGYYLYDDGKLQRRDIKIKPVVKMHVDVDGMAADAARAALHSAAEKDVTNAIVLLRLTGMLATGNQNELDIRKAVSRMEEDAYAVLRNTAGLTSREFEQQAPQHEEPRDVEEALLSEHEEQLRLPGTDGVQLARQLMKALSREQREGERNYEYEEAVTTQAMDIIEKHK